MSRKEEKLTYWHCRKEGCDIQLCYSENKLHLVTRHFKELNNVSEISCFEKCEISILRKIQNLNHEKKKNIFDIKNKAARQHELGTFSAYWYHHHSLIFGYL